MKSPETEMLFAYTTREVADRIYNTSWKPSLNDPFVVEFAENVEDVLQGSPRLERKSKTDKILEGAGCRASLLTSTIVLHTEAFSRWTDKDRRYLLDCSLGKEIAYVRYEIAAAEAQKLYYPQRDISITASEHLQTIGELTTFQTMLRQKANPAPSRMRK